jgi:rare lipoprotein A
MSLDNVDGTKITVSWKANKESTAKKAAERYSIKVKDVELVEINANTRLPEQTKNLAEDALQATNRLRRLLGNAQPLSKIAGMPQPKLPKPPQNIALGPVRFSLSGLASWYGPGFHGRRSANGEIYNQNALTAAHKSLPFGTRVRVTNKHTGRSVVVRINDRGPYVGSRVIDLSAAAARTIGVIRTGTAPVIVDVLGR